MLSHNAARVITGPEELREAVRQLLRHPEEAQRLGQTAREFVGTQRGATQRTVDLIAGVVQDRSRNPEFQGRTQTPFVRSKSYWPVLKWVLFVIVMAFVVRRAMQLWESAPPKSIHIQWPWLIAAALFYLAGWLPSVWFWKALLNRFQQPLDWRHALRAYYVGHIGKYIPGKALVLVIRGSMVKEAGVNPLWGGVTAAYETLVFMATGAALCLAIAPFAFTSSQWNRLPTQLSWLKEYPFVVCVGVILLTLATTPFSAMLFSRIGRKALSRDATTAEAGPSISAGLISVGVVMTSLGWVCHALSLGCVLQSVSEGPIDLTQFPTWLGACTLSTVGGFVVLIAPGGLGVREGLLIEALQDQPHIGPSTAVIAAGLLRAVWFITELVAAASLWIVKPRP